MVTEPGVDNLCQQWVIQLVVQLWQILHQELSWVCVKKKDYVVSLKATKKWLLIKIKCTIECSYHTIQGNITTNTARIGYRQFMARYHSFFHRFGWTPLINSKWAIYTLEWREVKWVLLAQHNDEDRVCRPDLSKS